MMDRKNLPGSGVPGLGVGRPRIRHLRAAAAIPRNPARSRASIVDLQQKHLGELLRYAQKNIPYYRDLFVSANADPEAKDAFATLRSLPPLARMDLVSEPSQRMMRPGAQREGLVPERSSGSTGIKLHLWREPFEAHLLQMFRMRYWLHSGLRPWHRFALLRGTFASTKQPLPITGIRQFAKIFHTHDVSTQQPPATVLDQLRQLEPDAIFGYPSVVHEVARQALDAGANIRPRLVSTGGEMLSTDMQATIGQAFSAPVINTYGAMEFNLLATQCPSSDLFHVLDDAVHLEILANGKPVEEGQLGEVVATGLHSYTFPLIRYRLGDLAIKGPDQCPCGAPFSTIRELRGRTVEYFYSTSGEPVHHWTLSTTLFKNIRDARHQYQFVQKDADHIVLRLVQLREITAAEIAEMKTWAAELLGADMTFEVIIEDEIPCAPSGKMVQSRNLYKSPWLGEEWDPADWDRWQGGIPERPQSPGRAER